MKGKKFALGIGVICMLVALIVVPHFANGAKAASAPYKIGFITSITGFMSPMGSGARDAAQLVVKRINANGGVNGHPLELIMYDDGSDPSKGVMAIKKLIGDDKVLAVIGPLSTGIAMACAPIAEKANVPIFTQNSSSWAVALRPWKIPNPPEKIRNWVFKAAIDPIFLDIAIYKMLKTFGAKKIAHLNVNNAMGKAMKASFAASCKGAGFEVVIWEEYGRGDTDLSVPLTKIKAKDFDAIVIAGAEMAGAIAYKQAREMGITQPIIGMPPLIMGKIVNVLGKSLDGLLVASFVVNLGEALPMDDPQRPPVVALTKLISENTGRKRADTGHTAGWDGIYLCADALKRANPDLNDLKKARSQIRDAFESIKGYVGVQSIGDMTRWHEIPAPMIPCELKDGKLQIIGKKITPKWADLQ
ncbi:ABC transporter substrate-binding protein [Thermodesulfobacteriota bacterium]